MIENTSSAVQAAVDQGFAVEIDVQGTADGEAVVFHDSTLDRLTQASGPIADRPLREVLALNVGGGADRVWTLADCLDLVDGRVPLVVEVKASRGGDTRLARRVAELLADRGGPVAAKSFDPRVLVLLRSLAPRVPRGIVGDAFDPAAGGWTHLSGAQRFVARNMLHWRATRPDFISWNVRDLQRRAVRLARGSGVPVMAWTVRTPEDQARAARGADQMVFESFLPTPGLGTAPPQA